MRRLVVLLSMGLALLTSGSARAQPDAPPRERVAALLERGDSALARAMDDSTRSDQLNPALREAVASYGTVLDAGLESAALRMNLASAEAQLGDRGRAALHLRAAGRLAMERGDEAGLRAASAAYRALRPGAGDAWPPKILPEQARFALRAAHSAGVETLLGVFLACWTLGWALLGLRVAKIGPSAPLLAVGATLLAGVVVGSVLVGAVYAEEASGALGVVVRDGVTPRAGPGEAFDTAAGVADAGVDVRVLGFQNDWLRVRLESGQDAWIPSVAVERLGVDQRAF